MGKEQEETYRLLVQGNGFRIGLTIGPGISVPPSITIELLIRLFQTGNRLGPNEMDRATKLVRSLTSMGNLIFFHEDGWVSCEKPVDDVDIEMEVQDFQYLLEQL